MKFLPAKLLIILLLWRAARYQGYQYDELQQPIGAFLTKVHDAYITHSNWRLLYYYDLADFYKNVELYKDCMYKMEQICSEIVESNACIALVHKHNTYLDEIGIDMDYLKTFEENQSRERTYRKKRSAPLGLITTYVYKPLFGIMDEDDANEFKEKINEIIDKQEAHHVVLENNLSIIKRSMELTNVTLQTFKDNIELMNGYIKNAFQTIADVEKDLKKHIDFHYMSQLATTIRAEHEKAVKTIKNAITNQLNGDYTEIMTHKQLIRDLAEVLQHLDDTSVKLLTNAKDLQKTISITGTIIDKKLLIEVNIPIVDRNLFTLYKITPLPMRNANNIIVFDLTNQYFLVHNATRMFIPMTVNSHSCRDISHKNLLCYPPGESFYENTEICESNILFQEPSEIIQNSCCYKNIFNKTYVIELNENHYFVTPKKKTKVIENCRKRKSEYTTIEKDGILKLDMNCEIIINKRKITPKFTKIRGKIINLPSANRTFGINIKNISSLGTKLDKSSSYPEMEFLNFNEGYEKLVNDTLVESKRLHDHPPISKMALDVAFYITIGTTILIALIIVWVLVKCTLKFCC